MSSVQSLPPANNWTHPENSLPVLRGTDDRERLEANPGQDSVLIGGGAGDQLVGAKGANTFKYEKASDSLSDDPDTIFNFNPKQDEIDLSEALKENGITAIHIQDEAPKEVGDVQITHNPFGVSTLTMKLTPEGPLFSIRVDNVKLLPEHIKFYGDN
ncbi:M10 family metallopeptidase C-terminal domain-containing protein [Pseudomonas sp. CBZ-4]|uniref:M10 family metallopeptidase C-terminal domain-containing protein n=1 Tax=Pseudomonas sp. CBZ-4 TaxID=1163065 RepID=UPI0004779658|nr:M10 family metallopeptidase C-terminal domain-containing protein [Pseudomonas sp. CBZ-4]